MSKLYFGFALADSMFAGDCVIRRYAETPEDVAVMLETAYFNDLQVVSCCNPSHVATIAALSSRYPGIASHIAIPGMPPRVSLTAGDVVIVMGVRGLPRLTDRHEYTPEEIEGATFMFSLYEVERRTDENSPIEGGREE